MKPDVRVQSDGYVLACAVEKVDLVLEGRVKNVALLGAVTVLVGAGSTFLRVAGTSGGAIIAA